MLGLARWGWGVGGERGDFVMMTNVESDLLQPAPSMTQPWWYH